MFTAKLLGMLHKVGLNQVLVVSDLVDLGPECCMAGINDELKLVSDEAVRDGLLVEEVYSPSLSF